MLASPLLKKNTDLYVFLPVLYTVWSDAVLTPSEVATLQGLIESQTWLTTEERSLLLDQINPSTPPSPDEFITWREEIKKVTNGTTGNSLVELGMKLAALHGDGSISRTLENEKSSLAKIETTLGLISYEAAYRFQSAHATITSSQTTQKNFDINEMTKILDGNNAEIIRKVKTLLSDPEFEYIGPGDLNLYRTKVLQWCKFLAEQGYGSMAYYLSENRIEVLKNDTDIYTTFEGDNTVLMQLVAKSRLTEFKQEFSNMNVFTILNYVADQAKTSISQMNPITVRSTSDEHLLDPEFQLSAFKYRERDILTSAARRLKRHIDSGMDSFDAFNVCQHHLVQVGFAYIERIILEQFILQVATTKDAGCKAVLKKLCDLFALSQIDNNKGWYLEQGYMEGVKTKAIRKMVNQLCWEVRQDAVPLTDAFAIPDRCLSAPIAL